MEKWLYSISRVLHKRTPPAGSRVPYIMVHADGSCEIIPAPSLPPPRRTLPPVDHTLEHAGVTPHHALCGRVRADPFERESGPEQRTILPFSEIDLRHSEPLKRCHAATAPTDRLTSRTCSAPAMSAPFTVRKHSTKASTLPIEPVEGTATYNEKPSTMNTK